VGPGKFWGGDAVTVDDLPSEFDRVEFELHQIFETGMAVEVTAHVSESVALAVDEILETDMVDDPATQAKLGKTWYPVTFRKAEKIAAKVNEFQQTLEDLLIEHGINLASGYPDQRGLVPSTWYFSMPDSPSRSADLEQWVRDSSGFQIAIGLPGFPEATYHSDIALLAEFGGYGSKIHPERADTLFVIGWIEPTIDEDDRAGWDLSYRLSRQFSFAGPLIASRRWIVSYADAVASLRTTVADVPPKNDDADDLWSLSGRVQEKYRQLGKFHDLQFPISRFSREINRPGVWNWVMSEIDEFMLVNSPTSSFPHFFKLRIEDLESSTQHVLDEANLLGDRLAATSANENARSSVQYAKASQNLQATSLKISIGAFAIAVISILWAVYQGSIDRPLTINEPLEVRVVNEPVESESDTSISLDDSKSSDLRIEENLPFAGSTTGSVPNDDKGD
jgi:hypothetical protein